jgi:AcrR family transcriptional regulator
MVETAEGRAPAPRDRLMAAAQLFYAEGIRAVGVDRLTEKAKTPVMSLYRHFGSKEGLVEAFLHDTDVQSRAKFQREIERRASTGKERVLAAFDVLGAVIADPSYRGCTFINVSVEMADPHHPFVDIAVAHKAFMRAILARYLAEAGLRETGALATQLLLLMDGVFVRAQMHADHGDAAFHGRKAAEVLLDSALLAQADASAGGNAAG